MIDIDVADLRAKLAAAKEEVACLREAATHAKENILVCPGGDDNTYSWGMDTDGWKAFDFAMGRGPCPDFILDRVRGKQEKPA